MPLDMQLPKNNGLFIASANARAGKSLVIGAISRILVEKGLRVGVFKPVAVGARNKWDGLLAAEVELLSKCANSNLPFTTINPVAYVTDAVPVLGAMREKKPVDFEAIAAAYKQVCEESDIVLVEGLDGVRTPITNEYDQLDLAVQFDLHVVLVAAHNDSTVNTTLMTIDCVRGAGLHIAGVVINGYDIMQHESVAGNTAPEVIEQFGQAQILADVPFDETVDIESQDIGETAVVALSEVDWQNLARR